MKEDPPPSARSRRQWGDSAARFAFRCVSSRLDPAYQGGVALRGTEGKPSSRDFSKKG